MRSTMELEKRRTFIINFIYLLLITVIVFLLLKYVMPLLLPFALAFCLAYFLRHPIRLLSRMARLPYKLSAVVVVTGFYGVIGGILTLLCIKSASWLRSLVKFLPRLYSDYIEPILTDVFYTVEQFFFHLDTSVFEMISNWDTQLMQSLGDMVTELSAEAVGLVSGVAAFLPGFVVKLVMMVISTYFIAADYEKLTGFILYQFSKRAKELLLQIKEYLVGTLFVCIRSYLLIMLITFAELSIGLTVIGVGHSILISAGIALFDILPVFGTGGIVIPWIVISFLSGEYTFAIRLLIVYLIITVIRNFIEPKIVGKELGLHPFLILASMFIGTQMFGFAGLFGLPICLSLLRYLNDNGTIHLFKMPPSDPPPAQRS